MDFWLLLFSNFEEVDADDEKDLWKAESFSKSLQLLQQSSNWTWFGQNPEFLYFLENIKIFVQAVEKFEKKDKGCVVYFSFFFLLTKGWVELYIWSDLQINSITLNTDSA